MIVLQYLFIQWYFRLSYLISFLPFFLFLPPNAKHQNTNKNTNTRPKNPGGVIASRSPNDSVNIASAINPPYRVVLSVRNRPLSTLYILFIVFFEFLRLSDFADFVLAFWAIGLCFCFGFVFWCCSILALINLYRVNQNADFQNLITPFFQVFR